MSIKVTYSTKAFPADSQAAKITELSFESLDEAKNAPFPKGYVFAYIPVENGYYVYTATLGWEFNKK